MTRPRPAVSEPLPPSGLYFCLSHAAPPTGHDHWVSVFFKDLNAEVSRRARRRGGPSLGFADVHSPGARLPGQARDAAIARALASAQVLVPLYSPDYVGRQDSYRELVTFRQRIPSEAATAHPGNIQPVLWVPLDEGQHADHMDRALELGSAHDGYQERGLAAMCRISKYREQYKQIVATLAGRIVEVAEQSLLTAAQSSEFADTTPPASDTLHFVVAVIAPDDGQLPEDRDRECYGSVSYAWRPFRNAHPDPIADVASREAWRLSMPTRIVDFAAGDSTLEASPGLILVDPWIVRLRKGEPLLREAFRMLRQWVGLIVVVDRDDRQYGRTVAELAGQVMRMRQNARSGQLVRDAAQFERVVQKTIARVRRQYLSEGPSYPPPGPFPLRERLVDPKKEPPSQPGATR
jgi:FxsC-like protein